MKKVLLVVVIIIIVVAIALVSVYAYYGGFRTITFKTEEAGGEILVYEEVTGDYSQSPKVMDRVYYALLNDDKIETTKGFGIYYDDPKDVEKSKLRSEIGCIINEPIDSTTLADLSKKYKVKILPKGTYITTEFPNKGMMSTLVAIVKVYPALDKYVKENGFYDKVSVMEIYDVPNKKIIYRKKAIK